MDAHLTSIISKFEQLYNVHIVYNTDPCNFTYMIQMRSGEKVVCKSITGLHVLGGDLIDCLFELYSKLFEKTVEPEKVEPKDTPPPTNCPNCGAVVTSRKCEYCGTIHWGFEEPATETVNCYADNKLVMQLKAENQALQSAARTEELYANALTLMRNYAMTPNEVREAAGLNIHHTGQVASFNSLENAKAYAEKEHGELVKEKEELDAEAVRCYAEILFSKTEQPKKPKKRRKWLW